MACRSAARRRSTRLLAEGGFVPTFQAEFHGRTNNHLCLTRRSSNSMRAGRRLASSAVRRAAAARAACTVALGGPVVTPSVPPFATTAVGMVVPELVAILLSVIDERGGSPPQYRMEFQTGNLWNALVNPGFLQGTSH